MSNLRSDAMHFASTMTIDSPCSTYITRLCCQIDEVEERWHKAESALAAANARIARLREALRSLEWAGDTKGDGPDSYCVHCMAFEDEGHVAGCAYAEAIADLGEPPATAKETQHER